MAYAVPLSLYHSKSVGGLQMASWRFTQMLLVSVHASCYHVVAPAGMSPRGRNPRGGTLVTRACNKESIYS